MGNKFGLLSRVHLRLAVVTLVALVDASQFTDQQLAPSVPSTTHLPATFLSNVRGGAERSQGADTVAPRLSCPEAYEQQGRACVKILEVELSQYCPDQYTWNAANDECEAHNRKPARMSCPTGSVQKSNKCEVTDFLPSSNACEPGWSYEDGLCVKLGNLHAKTVCPEGFKYSKNGCTAQSRLLPDYSCPPSFELIGKNRCEAWVYEKPLRECPAETILLDGICVKESKQQPSFQCEHQTGNPLTAHVSGKVTHSEDTCYLETVVKPVHKCGQGLEQGKAGHCEFVLTQTPRWGCPSGFEQHPTDEQRCVKVLEKAKVPFCSPGFKLDENDELCTRVFQQKADVACPEGTLSRNGNCVIVSTSPAQLSCPRGYKLVNGFCSQISTKQPVERCPRGYRPTLYKDECEMVVAVNPELVCPEGYIYSKTSSYCENFDITPTIAVCEDGSLPSLDGKCRKVETKLPKPDCPTNFTLKNGECFRVGHIPGVHYCDEGQVVGDECDLTIVVNPLAECPKGFIAVNNQCQRTEVLEAKLDCPKRYKLKNGLCFKI